MVVGSLAGGFHRGAAGLGQERRVAQGAVSCHSVPAGSEATVGAPTSWPPPSFPAWAALRWEQISILHPSLASHEEAGDQIIVLKCPTLYFSPFATDFVLSVSFAICPSFLSLLLFCLVSLSVWSHGLARRFFPGDLLPTSRSPRLLARCRWGCPCRPFVLLFSSLLASFHASHCGVSFSFLVDIWPSFLSPFSEQRNCP